MNDALLEPDVLARGQQVRREVLGPSHVQASYDVDALSRPKTQMSEYVWSKIWARPGLSRKSRSIANLAMLTALNRPHELKLHVKAAINNGLTQDEIGEVLLQTAVYCGVAAAEDSFRIAREAFKEIGLT
jgi:4-carboxymuconolactone decarboxylase